MFLGFVAFVGCVYLCLGHLTLILLLIDYYRRLPASQRSSVEFVREVLGGREEWKDVVFVIFVWPKVWTNLVSEWWENRRVVAEMKKFEACMEQRRAEDEERWQELNKERKAAAAQASKPPRKVRKAIARRQRHRS